MNVFVFINYNFKKTPERSIYEKLSHYYDYTYPLNRDMVLLIDKNNTYKIYSQPLNKFIEIGYGDIFIVRNAGVSSKNAQQILFYLTELSNKLNLQFYNPFEILKISGDKYYNYLLFKQLGIPTPKTLYVPKVNYNITDTRLVTMASLIGYPLVMKGVTGSLGNGVTKIYNEDQIKSIAEILYKKSGPVLLQEYIESEYDIRIFTVGKNIIGAEKRLKIKNDFRSNVSKGAQAEIYYPDEELLVYVNKIIDYFYNRFNGQLFTMGFDFIFDKYDNPYCLEINSSPGTKGISEVLGYDVTDKIVEIFIKENGLF